MTLTYHIDPGHGWLEVTQNDLTDVGLSWTDFSSCSYTDGKRMYLEEDCDMGKFIEAYRQKHGKRPNLKEAYSDPCFIRNLPHNPVS